MFTLPRDTVDVPVPAGPARNYFGPTFPGKINQYWSTVHNRTDFYPAIPGIEGGPGYNGIKAVLGNLYGLDIKYFVEVNFEGFKKIVDALGGVTINVQIPVVDDHFPAARGELQRLYIPAGLQHMDGAAALRYARSRHTSSDFDRGARQQRVLVSLREQTNLATILPAIDALTAAVKGSFTTDIPRELVPQLLQVADHIDARSIASVIFTPPYYQTEYLNSPRGYIIVPRIDRIRAAVQAAFNIDPAFAEQRDAVAEEGAEVWVLNGSGEQGEAATIAAYLDYLGIAATAPNQRPDTTGRSGTTVKAYNGAETTFPLTVAALQKAFNVTVVPVSDPNVRVDFVVITANSTPELTPPPVP
jgi:LCP family protein required for cell wall assembly